MKNYGLTSISTFLGDNIVYRNLQPIDERLPAFADIAARLGINETPIPRKSEPDYARVMATLLRYARSLDGGDAAIQWLVYVGDTRLNDGTAFTNLCRTGSWPGIAFIGSEKQGQPADVEVAQEGGHTLYLANRWQMLEDFEPYCREQGVTFDAHTAIILDLDKTTLGARGRNDHVINAARLEAVRQTVQELLGAAFDTTGFESSYNRLNKTEFHPFTTDNQDYLAYLCLILGSDLFTLDDLVDDIRSGKLSCFTEFLDLVEARVRELPDSLGRLHADIYSRVRAGEATPFKAFRYNEYRATVSRMGKPAGDADIAARLDQEIVITQEVRERALAWQAQGALLFGLSDKPDEASIPTESLVKQGYQAIHRTQTHALGAGGDAD
jgi:hypothetical protein